MWHWQVYIHGKEKYTRQCPQRHQSTEIPVQMISYNKKTTIHLRYMIAFEQEFIVMFRSITSPLEYWLYIYIYISNEFTSIQKLVNILVVDATDKMSFCAQSIKEQQQSRNHINCHGIDQKSTENFEGTWYHYKHQWIQQKDQ